MDNLKLKITEELKKVSRRMDEMQKTLDLIHDDRNMLEDLILRVGELENALHMNREVQKKVQQEIKADISDVKFAVEDKVSEVKDIVDNKDVILVKPNVFSKIKKALKL